MGFVYKIENKVNSKYYIGSTKDYTARCKVHLSTLRRGCHQNKHLQYSFDKYGEDAFKFHVLQETENWLVEEQKLLDCGDWDMMYNINPNVSGGDILSNHPDRLSIIEKIRDTLTELHQLPDEINPWRDRDVKGINNPNYKNWISVEKRTCSCGKDKASNAKTCSMCRDRKGENNPFYGKKHTQGTKDLIKDKLSGKVPPNRKCVMVEGVVYNSMSEVARHYGIGVSLVSYRCTKSTNALFKDWFIQGEDKHSKPRKTTGIPVYCEGTIFASVSDACKEYKLSSCAMNNRFRSKNYPEFYKL